MVASTGGFCMCVCVSCPFESHAMLLDCILLLILGNGFESTCMRWILSLCEIYMAFKCLKCFFMPWKIQSKHT